MWIITPIKKPTNQRIRVKGQNKDNRHRRDEVIIFGKNKSQSNAQMKPMIK